MGKRKEEISIRSSAAEYLTYIAAVGDDDGELMPEATIKKYLTVQTEGKR